MGNASAAMYSGGGGGGGSPRSKLQLDFPKVTVDGIAVNGKACVSTGERMFNYVAIIC